MIACHGEINCATYDGAILETSAAGAGGNQSSAARKALMRMQRAAIIGGHFTYDIEPILLRGRRGLVCLTLVREPVARMISYYYERIFPRSRMSLLEASPERVRVMLASHRTELGSAGTQIGVAHDEGAVNTTLKTMCGPRRVADQTCGVAIAAERLRTGCLVGLTDRHDETCALLNAYLPWLKMNCTLALHVGGYPQPHHSAAALPSGVGRVLEELAGPTDQPLYEVAVARFQQQIEASRRSCSMHHQEEAQDATCMPAHGPQR